MQIWTDFFLSQARFGLEWASRRYLVVAFADGQRASYHLPPEGEQALGPVEPSRGRLVTPAEAVTSSKPIAPAGLGLDPLGGAWLFILATGRIENAWIVWVTNEARPEGLRNGKGLVGRYFTRPCSTTSGRSCTERR